MIFRFIDVPFANALGEELDRSSLRRPIKNDQGKNEPDIDQYPNDEPTVPEQ
jgi:hypothetical protein